MDAKLDSMAQSGALDPALLLTIAKAHSSVKDTDYTREEVKDVMAHLYFKVSTAQHLALYWHVTTAAMQKCIARWTASLLLLLLLLHLHVTKLYSRAVFAFQVSVKWLLPPNLPQECIMSIATTSSSELFS